MTRAAGRTNRDRHLTVARHAAIRYAGRRDHNPGYGPLEAWRRAEPVPGDGAPVDAGLDVDRARYHDDTDVVLVANRDYVDGGLTIVTVLEGSTASDPRLRAAVREVSSS